MCGKSYFLEIELRHMLILNYIYLHRNETTQTDLRKLVEIASSSCNKRCWQLKSSLFDRIACSYFLHALSLVKLFALSQNYSKEKLRVNAR